MIVAALLLALLPRQMPPVPGPTPTATPTAPAPVAPGLVRVALVTSLGTITLDLERARAPITTANFLRYLDQRRLDGIVFYRRVRPAADFGFVQFGVQGNPKRYLPPIVLEPSTRTGVKHTDGAISVARLEPDSGRGEFTINVGDQPSLDAGSGSPADNLGYAAFGHVVAGMDVVKRILDTPVDPAKGPFKGETIADPIKVLSVRRVQQAKTVAGEGLEPPTPGL